MQFIEVIDTERGVREIRFARPEKLNAINPTMREEFVTALDDAVADDDVRVIVISGSGRAFSVGNDFSGYAPGGVSEGQQRLDDAVQTYLKLWNAPKPIIAKVHGYCMGISTLLCICADLVYVADDAKVGWPILPIGGGMIAPAWAWQVGAHKAKEFSFQPGYELTGTEAAQLGWANDAVPADQLDDRVRDVAREIRRVPPEVMRVKKAAINRVFDAQGFQSALRDGSAWDAITHADPATKMLRERIAADGIRGARAWYTEQEMI